MNFTNIIFKQKVKLFSKYLIVFFSIIAGYVFVSLAYIYFDNILLLIPDILRMNSIYISIRTAILLAGVMLVVYQYHRIFESGILNNRYRRTVNKSKLKLYLNIWRQALLLILVTGMAGIVIRKFAISTLNPVLVDFAHDSESTYIINARGIYLITAALWVVILSLGGYSAWKLQNVLKQRAKEGSTAILKNETIQHT